MTNQKVCELVEYLENIEPDDFTSEQYTDMEGCHCVLGWAAIKAGIKLPNVRSDENTYHIGVMELGETLANYYEVDIDTLKNWQYINDESVDKETIIAKVKEECE